MTESSPYDTPNLLLLIGQSTVELAYLRGRIVELERQLAERSDNGVTELPPELAVRP